MSQNSKQVVPLSHGTLSRFGLTSTDLAPSSCAALGYTVHWPFPEFREGTNYENECDVSDELKRQRRAYSSSSSGGSEGSLDDADHDLNKSEQSTTARTRGDIASDMSALRTFRKAQQRGDYLRSIQKCAVVAAHPLSSDWNLSVNPKPYRDHVRHEIEKTAVAEERQLNMCVQKSHLRASSRVGNVLSDHLCTISETATQSSSSLSRPSPDWQRRRQLDKRAGRIRPVSAPMVSLAQDGEGGVSIGASSRAVIGGMFERSATPLPEKQRTDTRLSSTNAKQKAFAPITLDDLTLLFKLFESDVKLRRTSAALAKVDTRHMSLDWIGKRMGFSKQVVPPLVNRHLGNFANHAAKCDGDIEPSRVLINSPRSAIVLLRNGMSVSELIPRPAVAKKARMLASQQALITQTQRKDASNLTRMIGNAEDLRLSKHEEEVERLRLQRLSKLVAEYVAVCSMTDMDDVIAFCNQFDKERPSSALRLECTLASYNHGNSKVGDLLPEAVAEEKFQRLYDRHAAFERTVIQCQQKVIADDESKRALAAQRLAQEQKRLEKLMATRAEKASLRKDERLARESVKKLQQSAVERCRAYHVSTLREPVIRRDDEVHNIEMARRKAIARYKSVIIQDIHKDDTKKVNESAARVRNKPASVSWNGDLSA